MKRFIKRALRAVWEWAAPIRRPIMAKIEATLVRCGNASRPSAAPEDMMVLMDHLVRELVRLQIQVETLQETIDELAATDAGLSVVGRVEGHPTLVRTVAS